MPPIDELLKTGDHVAAINELRNGRLTTLPNSEQYTAQYNPKLHDINDPRKRPDKIVVTDKNSEEYGEVKNINVNAEMTTETVLRYQDLVLAHYTAAAKRLVKADDSLSACQITTYSSHLSGKKPALSGEKLKISGGVCVLEELSGGVDRTIPRFDLTGKPMGFVGIALVGVHCILNLRSRTHESVAEGIERLLLLCLGGFETGYVLATREQGCCKLSCELSEPHGRVVDHAAH